MGRTAKYKKIKSFDPYSKQNGGRVSLSTVGIWGLGDDGRKAKKKSKTVQKLKEQKLNRLRKKAEAKGKTFQVKGSREGFDLVPLDQTGDDFDMADLKGSLKKQTPVNPLDDDNIEDETDEIGIEGSKNSLLVGKKPSDPMKEAAVEAKEAEKLLKLDSTKPGGAGADINNTSSNNNKLQEGRQENESKNAYKRRVKAETRQIIKQQKLQDLNPEKRRKKKEFLNQKKKRKRSKGNQHEDADAGDDQDYYHDQQPEHVPFGTQVERPPTFKTVPRGAKATKKPSNNNNKNKSDLDVAEEQRNLEKMRQKVQEQYAIIKAKRKRAGDFHL